jgi:hypothetical protein
MAGLLEHASVRRVSDDKLAAQIEMMATNSTIDGLPLDVRPHDDREVELLIHCARASLEPERAERTRALATAELNWDRLLKLAQRNGLAPVLYHHLGRICATSVPARPLEVLRDHFQKNTALSLLRTGELVRLLGSLNDHGIQAIPYKGPTLAVTLYGHLALRQFCDLDILVRKSDVWNASALIEAQGFDPHFRIPETKRAAFVRLGYVQLFRRDAGRTLVELHWGIAPRFFAVPFDMDAVWRRLEPMSLQGATVWTPCPEDLLLMLCVHGAKDHWEKLEWVASLAEMLRREGDVDWERVWLRSREMHCQALLAFGLLLAHGLYDVPLPRQAAALCRTRRLRALAGDVVQRFWADDVPPRTFARQVAFHLRLKDTYADRVRHCVRLALTTTPVDWSTMRLPGPLSFAYALFRAIRLTRKYGVDHGRAAARRSAERDHAA